MGQESESGLGGWFWLRVSHEVAMNMPGKLQPSEHRTNLFQLPLWILVGSG